MIFVIPGLDVDSRPRGVGKCSICNTHGQPGDRALRLGEVIDFEGFFDICEQCGREIAKTIGWVAPEALASEAARADAAEAYASALEEHAALKQDTIDHLALELGTAAQRVIDARAMYTQGVVQTTVVTEPDFGAGPLVPLVPGA